ncbi:lycopene cyclase family protein [Euzebyella saccharophila]|uniref:Lycopene cyclase family protein n=1 Tax=Euzebyella saccharophila TaxID=679664 RepID=A0ABV8JQ53_9FLAO|nr:lycopene cyclase family protein [Euzebyella saccharophila]
MSNQTIHYDYIIIGAGAAGLMLAKAMSQDSFFDNSSILLLDKDSKTTNDRTWCFWEKGKGPFDHLVSKEWKHIHFSGKGFSKDYKIAPFTYKMVKGLDFYEDALNYISTKNNIRFKVEEVLSIEDKNEFAFITTSKQTYSSKRVFNSMFSYDRANQQTTYPVLQQHFLGWKIRTDQAVFDKDKATYMDFSVPQKGNTRFMYMLPFSSNEALVEYTLFSKDLLSEAEYKDALQTYISEDLQIKNFEIVDTEYGSIPMTCYPFSKNNSRHIYHIGTAGGWAKPSTGYAFMSTARKIPKLIHHLKTDKSLNILKFKNRFWYYDLILLDVLAKNNSQGHSIFTSIFRKRSPQLLFNFLDENTSLKEELYFIWSCPKWLFTKYLAKRLGITKKS